MLSFGSEMCVGVGGTSPSPTYEGISVMSDCVVAVSALLSKKVYIILEPFFFNP